MPIRVDLVYETQHESLMDLLCELHTYYNEGSVVSRELVQEHLFENLWGVESPHRLVMASGNDGEVRGSAAITLVYSLVDFAVDKRKHCQLKELYVRPLVRHRMQVRLPSMGVLARIELSKDLATGSRGQMWSNLRISAWTLQETVTFSS